VAPYFIRQKRFDSNPGNVFDYRLTDEAASIVQRLLNSFPAVEDGFEFGVGINTGFVRDEMTSDHKRDAHWHPMVPGTGISRYGPVETSGWILYDSEFTKRKGDRARSLPQERFFSEDKILVVRTRNLSLARRIVATVDTTGAYNLNRLSNIIARSDHDLLGLLGLLNSRLFDWLFSTRFYDYEIKPVYLRQCPLADDTDSGLTTAVADMLLARGSAASERADPERVRRLREVDALDQRIDRLVYDLYEVAESERALIEEQMEAAFAFGRTDDQAEVDVA
jgi:adenine-specific DNA-methyltransferase